MADIPDTIVLRRHRDLEGRRHQQWIRRGLLLLPAGLIVAALANVFGQRPSTDTSSVRAASLQVYAPEATRGGLFWEARFTITAHRELRRATLVLAQGWLEGVQINTIEPSPIGEGSDDGKLVLELGHVPAGQKHVLYLQAETNPTNVGSYSHDVWLYDGQRLLIHQSADFTAFP